jgi:hypothetical protein
VVEGKIVGSGRGVIFRPKSVRFLAFTLLGGVFLKRQSFACLDCGLVWTSVDVDDLDYFIEKHCKQPETE